MNENAESSVGGVKGNKNGDLDKVGDFQKRMLFRGTRNNVYLITYHGHKIARFIPDVDKYNRLLEKYWHARVINHENIEVINSSWKEIMESYDQFIDSVADIVGNFRTTQETAPPKDYKLMTQEEKKAHRKKKKDYMNLIKTIAHKKVYYTNTRAADMFVMSVSSTDKIFRLLQKCVRDGNITPAIFEKINDGFAQHMDEIEKRLLELGNIVTSLNVIAQKRGLIT